MNRNWSHLNNLCLADPEYFRPRMVDIIIGADYYGSIIKPRIIKGDSNSPTAQLSIFGWIILGPISTSGSSVVSTHHTSMHRNEDALQELLKGFWVQEELPPTAHSTLTPEEEECETHFRTTHRRDSSGRYVVRIPLKCSPSVLGRSYKTASWCLKRMMRRLNKDAQYDQLYRSFMDEYHQLGHMRRVEDDVFKPEENLAHDALASGGLRALGGDSSDGSPAHHPYYLPHHGLLRADSSTTKLRVVFNGSSPTSTGKSLNDIMHTGANLLLNVMDMLIWIRHHRYLFATDVIKMFRQIYVHQDDWDLQRILWTDGQLNEVPFHLTTVTYGTKAAPFLATRVLLQLVEDEGDNFPLAIPSITQGRYVDDIFGASDSIDQLINIAKDVIGLCHAGGFPLAKWHTTDPELFASLSLTESTSTVSLDDCETKLLGLRWIPYEDKFIFPRSSAHNLTSSPNASSYLKWLKYLILWVLSHRL